MCFGGGAPATINQPFYPFYEGLAKLQIDAIRDTQSSLINGKQAELNAATLAQQSVLTQLRDLTTARASDTSANAARMAALIGTPPPDKSAAAPVVGRDRVGQAPAEGKRGLRIDRLAPDQAAPGAGLNITGGI